MVKQKLGHKRKSPIRIQAPAVQARRVALAQNNAIAQRLSKLLKLFDLCVRATYLMLFFAVTPIIAKDKQHLKARVKINKTREHRF